MRGHPDAKVFGKISGCRYAAQKIMVFPEGNNLTYRQPLYSKDIQAMGLLEYL